MDGGAPPPWAADEDHFVLLSSRQRSNVPARSRDEDARYRSPPPTRGRGEGGGGGSSGSKKGSKSSSKSRSSNDDAAAEPPPPWLLCSPRSPAARVPWRPEWLDDDDDDDDGDDDGDHYYCGGIDQVLAKSSPPPLPSPARKRQPAAIEEVCDVSTLSAPPSPAKTCVVCGGLYSKPVCKCTELAMSHPITLILARARSGIGQLSMQSSSPRSTTDSGSSSRGSSSRTTSTNDSNRSRVPATGEQSYVDDVDDSLAV